MDVFEAEAVVTKTTDKVVTSNLDGVENAVVFFPETNKEWSAAFQKRGNEEKINDEQVVVAEERF